MALFAWTVVPYGTPTLFPLLKDAVSLSMTIQKLLWTFLFAMIMN